MLAIPIITPSMCKNYAIRNSYICILIGFLRKVAGGNLPNILHFHDQANVARNLVIYGKRNKLQWHRIVRYPEFSKLRLFDYPYSIAADIAARKLAKITNAFLHIHGGHLTGLISRLDTDFILHLHGSEVRRFLPDGSMVSSITPATSSAILSARMVIFSTPDMAKFVHTLRPDAVWLPNPLSPELIHFREGNDSSTSNQRYDIFWPHSWSNAKGYSKVLSVVENVSHILGRPIRLLGIAHGEYQKLALAAGFHLMPVARRDTFWKYNLIAKVSLGQGSGIVAISDLESLAVSENFVGFPLESQTADAYTKLGKSMGPNSIDETVNHLVEVLRGDYLPKTLGTQMIKAHEIEIVGRHLESLYLEKEIYS